MQWHVTSVSFWKITALPYRANPFFLIVTQGGARGRACPGLVSAPPSGERFGVVGHAFGANSSEDLAPVLKRRWTGPND